MARENRIKVYRSTQGAAPPAFSSDAAVGPTFGEMAFSDGINSLFIGKDDGSLLWVGAQVTGGDVGQGLTTAVPTQAAVKAYVTSVSSGYWTVRDENGLTHQIDLTDTLTLTGGLGIDVLKSSTTDTLIFKGVTASTTEFGVAKFNSAHFSVTDGTVSRASNTLFNLQQGFELTAINFADALEVTGGASIGVRYSDAGSKTDIILDSRIATSGLSGVAAFASPDFTVTSSGVVSLNSLFVLRDGAGVTDQISATNTLTITGGPGVFTTRGGTDTISVRGVTATYSALGVASFNATHFSVTNGAVSLTAGPLFTLRDEKANTTAIAFGNTLSITGGPGINAFLDGQTDQIAIQGITADYTTLGVASFKQGDFVVSSGAVSLTSQLVTSVNGLTGAVTVVSNLPLANTTGTTGVAAFNANFFSVSATGTVSLTTVDGGTWP
jgi:hypothetical protein